MGNCACSTECEPPKYGERESDMELQTTKHCLMASQKSLSRRMTRGRGSSSRLRKKKKKAQICALGQEIYPTVSEHPTPAPGCIWTQSYEAAVKALKKEEFEEVEGTFREACTTQSSKSAKDEAAVKKRNETDSINADEFTRHFSNCFGRVGAEMANQLFSHLTESVDKHHRNFQDSTEGLRFEPLISAIYMWQFGTMRDKLILLFDMWDTDPKDGYLSMAELKRMVRATSRRHNSSAVMMMEALHLDISPLLLEDQCGSLDCDSDDDLSPRTRRRIKRIKKAIKQKHKNKGLGMKGMQKEGKECENSPQKKEVNFAKMIPDAKNGGNISGKKDSVQEAMEKEPDGKTCNSFMKPVEPDEKVGNIPGPKNSIQNMEAVDEISFEMYAKEHQRYENQVCGTIDDELELFTGEVFEDMDTKHDGLVSLDEWLQYASGDRNIDEFLQHFTLGI
mmetsp:Transcript_15756/g.38855  ORF Transcript_15756/g.38855 Transcript_15756/m.38855 type:complete len:450 (+) Transcript_15756:232-1581(+)